MKTQNKTSISYVFRNLLYLLTLSVFSAVLFALSDASSKGSSPICFYVNVAKANGNFFIENFYGDVYRYFTLIKYDGFFWVWFIGGISVILTQCIIFSMVERHMRLGVLHAPHIGRALNNFLLPTLFYFVGLTLCIEFTNLLTCGIIALCLAVGINGTFLIIVSLIVNLFFLSIALIAITVSICALPSCIMDAYKFNVALSYSIQLVFGDFWGTFRRVSMLTMGFVVLRLVFSTLFAYVEWFNVVFYFIAMFLLYVFILCVIAPTCLNNYLRLTKGQRKDILTGLF